MALNLEERFERYPLAYLPSPIRRLDRLSKELGTEIWAKRDDVSSGLAFGGNKIRNWSGSSWTLCGQVATLWFPSETYRKAGQNGTIPSTRRSETSFCRV
jgi:hypothetical protein